MKSADEACRLFAWISFVLGVVTGLIMGLWSFDGPVPTPGFLGDYDSLSRRMARLGHIAYFGLGFLTLLLSWELSKLALVEREKILAARTMILGNMFLPLSLFAASIYHPLKYLMPIPALLVFMALFIAARGAYRRYAEL